MPSMYMGYIGADWCHACNAPADPNETQTISCSSLSGGNRQYSYCPKHAGMHPVIKLWHAERSGKVTA